MALERLRAHGAAVGTVAVIAVAGVSVVSLAVAQGRLKEFDRDHRGETTSAAPSEIVPPSTGPGGLSEVVSPSTSTTTTTVAKSGPPPGLATELFALMNSDRAARGLEPLTWDGRLAGTAQLLSDTMADTQLVAHQDLEAILALGYTRAGENVLTSPYAANAISIEYGWMSSSAHRATILDAGLQHVGIGATSSLDGRIWIAVDFGGTS